MTRSKALKPNGRLQINSIDTDGLIPAFHTYFNAIDFGLCKTYQVFNEQLELPLNNCCEDL
jgi:hypothetical protein